MISDAATWQWKPHAVCIPFPAQGHINPMLKLTKVLHHKGFHITFVNTEYNRRRLLKSRGPSSLDGLPDFHFKTIPDGLPPTEVDATQDIPSLSESIMRTCLVPFRNLVAELNGTASGVPPVSCIIADGFMTFALDAAEQLGIPQIYFWTQSACALMAYLNYDHLVQRDLVPLKDVNDLSNGCLETTVDEIPGMKGMRLKDFPSFIRTTDPNEFMMNCMLHETQRATRATAVIINTFHNFESQVLNAMAPMLPPLYTIGPLNLLTSQLPESPVSSLALNLWKEETGCLQWLDGKAPGSVVYVNFGSITVMTNDQLIEFAWGLCNSNHDFLWVIRPDQVGGDSAVLPTDFLEETKERGLLASWCTQELVLAHRAIGGFLTHNGWNSTLESICSGVPMLSWPFFSDQPTNSRYACMEWGVAMAIDNDVKREKVAVLIRELMDEDKKGQEMRKRAFEWKGGAIAATQPGGSSVANLERLVN